MSFQSILSRSFGGIPFGGLEYGESQGGVALLLVDRWKNSDAPIAQFQNRLADLAFLIPHLDLVYPLHLHLAHLAGDRMISVSCQPIHVAAFVEMQPKTRSK